MTTRSRHSLRQLSLRSRHQLTPSTRKKFSSTICEHIQALPIYQQAKTIALYCATADEVDLTELQQNALASQKQCYWPKVQSNQTLLFLPVTPLTRLEKNKYNIQEPCVSSQLALEIKAFDLMLIPLVSFDDQGTRLGHGQGYYDRTLEINEPKMLIGVAFEVQHHPFIPRKSWDIPLSAVITEEKIYRFNLE
ncbi:MAG: 5-formyltetrahydrofolate cyclo-ligase [Legionellaceae bacterium]